MPRDSRMHIRLLTRNTGIRTYSWFEDPLLEVAEVFRLDVVANAFELPEFQGRVRFLFTKGEDWPAPMEGYEPIDPSEFYPETPADPEPRELTPRDYLIDLYMIVRCSDERRVDPSVDNLRGTALSSYWHQFDGELAADYAASTGGLYALRAAYNAMDPMEQQLFENSVNFLEDTRGDLENAIKIYYYAGDLSAAIRFLASTLTPAPSPDSRVN